MFARRCEPRREISGKGQRGIQVRAHARARTETQKKCEMQNTKTFRWMARAYSIARTIGIATSRDIIRRADRSELRVLYSL